MYTYPYQGMTGSQALTETTDPPSWNGFRSLSKLIKRSNGFLGDHRGSPRHPLGVQGGSQRRPRGSWVIP